jgi:hypothetical protein
MTNISEEFVDDILLFFVTFIPLIYFFPEPVLLLGCSHLTSLFCAKLLHAEKVNFYASLIGFICIFLTLVTDVLIFFFGICQFSFSDFCCQALNVVHMSCSGLLKNVLLGSLLTPLCCFNSVKSLMRGIRLWNQSANKNGTGMGALIVFQTTSMVLMILETQILSHGKLAFIIRIYSLFSIVLLINHVDSPLNNRDGGFFLIFMLDCINVCLQAFLFLKGEAPPIIFVFSLASFVTSIFLLLVVESKIPGGGRVDATFAFIYTLASTSIMVVIAFRLRHLFTPSFGMLYFFYVCSIPAKHHLCFFRLKSLASKITVVLFAVIDTGAVLVWILRFTGTTKIFGKTKQAKTEMFVAGCVISFALFTSVAQVVRKFIRSY